MPLFLHINRHQKHKYFVGILVAVLNLQNLNILIPLKLLKMAVFKYKFGIVKTPQN